MINLPQSGFSNEFTSQIHMSHRSSSLRKRRRRSRRPKYGCYPRAAVRLAAFSATQVVFDQMVRSKYLDLSSVSSSSVLFQHLKYHCLLLSVFLYLFWMVHSTSSFTWNYPNLDSHCILIFFKCKPISRYINYLAQLEKVRKCALFLIFKRRV